MLISSWYVSWIERGNLVKAELIVCLTHTFILSINQREGALGT